ncbi:MAG: hypothetical protein ACYTDW_04700 [Planctomycetota bacterium]
MPASTCHPRVALVDAIYTRRAFGPSESLADTVIGSGRTNRSSLAPLVLGLHYQRVSTLR